MAGDYSRELSVKVFKGQCRLITLGYRQGGPPGFGLRRMLIDERGQHKGILDRGEHKSIATDRVVLVQGPDEEVAIVREIYRRFVDERQTERQIADWLNTQGIMSDLERPWSRGAVHQILINDKYAGHNVWGRTSFKLKTKACPQRSGRLDQARSGVSRDRVAGRFRWPRGSLSSSGHSAFPMRKCSALLADILAKNGTLSGLIIDECEDGPSSSAFQSRFGRSAPRLLLGRICPRS
jgi:hypothetical protein